MSVVGLGVGGIGVLLTGLLSLVVVGLVGWLLWKLFQGIGFIIGGLFRSIRFLVARVARFVRDVLVDTLNIVGGLLTTAVIVPLALINLCMGRWSASRHYGRAVEDELMSSAVSLYRVALGHPIQLLGLSVVTSGLERRLPDLLDRAPRADRPRGGAKSFDGYKLIGTLPVGGSGARLYKARPLQEKVDQLRAGGREVPANVVIKSFRLEEGSTLPQIVRESRALEAASRMGLVLEHDLSGDSFHYVMPYVPGENLDTVIQRFHSRSGNDGLTNKNLSRVLNYASDMLDTLGRFHSGGLWHKDIKPSNLIVSNHRVHLVDLGLVTPLESAMTLTTHGTEYYRDPEMVRLALRGVKVHEVDGVKFDIYSAGAVFYTMIENSFPAQGSLSRITKRCPEALQWIIRRAMSDMGTRYKSTREMHLDLATVAAAKDPFKLRPADLPSVSGAEDDIELPEPKGPFVGTVFASVREGEAEYVPLPTGDRQARRSTRRRVLAAGLLFFLMLAGTRFMRSLASESRDYYPEGYVEGWSRQANLDSFNDPTLVPVRSPRLSTPDSGGLSAPEFGQLGTAAGGGLGPPAGLPAIQDDREEQLQRIANNWRETLAADISAAASSGGTALIVQDGTSKIDPLVLESLGSALQGFGYEVIGSHVMIEDAEREILFTAGARKAIGLSDPTDGRAVVRLQDYLDESGGLDVIVWVVPEADSSRRTFLYRALERRDAKQLAPGELVLDRRD